MKDKTQIYVQAALGESVPDPSKFLNANAKSSCATIVFSCGRRASWLIKCKKPSLSLLVHVLLTKIGKIAHRKQFRQLLNG